MFEVRALTEIAESVVVSPDISYSDTINFAAAINNNKILVAYNNKGLGPCLCLLALGSRLMV